MRLRTMQSWRASRATPVNEVTRALPFGSRVGRNDAALVAVPDGGRRRGGRRRAGPRRDDSGAETPDQVQRGATADPRQVAVLSALMVEATERDDVPWRVAASARPVEHVVQLEIGARAAAGSHAAPSVTGEDRIVGEVGRRIVRVPGRDEVFDEREEADPRRQAARADGKRPRGEAGRGGTLGGV